MVVYLLVLLVPSLLALSQRQKVSPISYALVFILLVVFVGLRDEIGPDWQQYVSIHYLIEQQPLGSLFLEPESFSMALFWLSQQTEFSVYLSNVVAAIILLTGVFSFALRTLNPWLAIASAMPYFIFIMGMSGIRQAMAAGIVLCVLARWERIGFLRRAIYILIAALFHTSAIINNIFLVTQLRLKLRYKIALGAIIFGLTLALGTEVAVFSISVDEYQQRYLSEQQVQSLGSLFHIALILLPAALAFALRKKLMMLVHDPQLLKFGLLASLTVLGLNFISSTAASRLTVYMYFIPMMIYPALTHAFGARLRNTITIYCIALQFILMFIWFSFANHKEAYIPYKNLLF